MPATKSKPARKGRPPVDPVRTEAYYIRVPREFRGWIDDLKPRLGGVSRQASPADIVIEAVKRLHRDTMAGV